MSLSIIIPCLNEADGIAGTLEALQPLRGRGAEVIVVDGGSRDETLAKAQPLADAAFAAPRGRAAQMNAGAARARGQILLFLHADCLLPEAADGLIIDGLNRSRKSWGRFDVRIDSRHPLLRVVASADEPALARHRHCHRRPGPLRDALAVRGGWRFSGNRADGRHRTVEAPQALRRAANLRHRITASGRRWEKHGVLRTVFLMWRLRLAYWLGADPDKLALRYEDNKR